MKVIAIILCSFMFSLKVFSQKVDSIAIYDPIRLQNFYNLGKPDIFQNADRRIGVIGSTSSLSRLPQSLHSNSLVIIDNKIHASFNELLRLDASTIKDIKIIKDDSSASGISSVILVRTK